MREVFGLKELSECKLCFFDLGNKFKAVFLLFLGNGNFLGSNLNRDLVFKQERGLLGRLQTALVLDLGHRL